MKTFLIFSLLIVLNLMVYPQYCTNDNRFTEKAVFTNDQISTDQNVEYGSAATLTGEFQNLIMNIYYPGAAFDTMSKRPLIGLMHGGMFLTGSMANLDSACIEFARRGFVAATMDYRKGWDFVPDCQSVTTNTVISANRAIYRAIQDLHASLRYLVHYADNYGIDTAWIFGGGVSAGAFASVDLAFITPQEFIELWPYCNDPKFGTPLGYINTSGNNFTDTFTLKGLFHNWGSIIDRDYIRPSNAIPLIGFAGELDKISPIDSGFFEGCINYELIFGTRAIYERITEYGVCAEMNLKIQAGHGVYNTTYEQGLFRIGRACCFFKSVFCESCISSYYTDSIAANCSLFTNSDKSASIPQLRAEPNPSNGHLTLLCDSPIGSCIKVYNIEGKLVHEEMLKSPAQEINLSNCGEGIFVLAVDSARIKIILRK
jgi:poly(3-hydroxybutyrate) depolymerase